MISPKYLLKINMSLGKIETSQHFFVSIIIIFSSRIRKHFKYLNIGSTKLHLNNR